MSKNHINMLQNLLILLLSVSALLLFIRQQTEVSLAALLSSGKTSSETANTSEESLTSVETVVRIAVSGAYGRYGDLHTTSTSDGFASIRNLLQEALGSAGSPATCTEQDFRTALDSTSVYCDWTVPLPMPVVAGIVGASSPAQELSVRRMALSVDQNSVILFFTDDTSYLRCTTKVSVEALLNLINGVQMDTVAFAYELGDSPTNPYSLLHTGELQNYPLLSSASAAQSLDTLLSALGFNPNTNSRYTESNGTEVVRDGERTLRIEPDSTLLYDSGGTSIPEMSISGESASTETAVLCAFRSLNRLMSNSDAGLCLKSVQSTQSGWLVTFDYHVDGVLLRHSSGEPAAQVEVDATGVTGFTIRLRRYTASENEFSLLLPLLQALAIASDGDGGELSICYVDSGSTVSAAWLGE